MAGLCPAFRKRMIIMRIETSENCTRFKKPLKGLRFYEQVKAHTGVRDVRTLEAIRRKLQPGFYKYIGCTVIDEQGLFFFELKQGKERSTCIMMGDFALAVYSMYWVFDE